MRLESPTVAAVAGWPNGELPPGIEPERRFRGLTFAEALATPIPEKRELVDGMIAAGSPGDVVGLPESGKSYAALLIACKIAAKGAGHDAQVFGRDVLHGGPVGFWFQDDSAATAIERVHRIANGQVYTDLPVRFHFAENLWLPDHLDHLRDEIEREGQVFAVLDSLYNYLPGLENLRDEEVAKVIAQIKTEVCDATGCTIAFVDHAPWPTEGNKGQKRGYGSMFKRAAFRWGLHLETKPNSDNKLWVQAKGNNLRGLRRSLFRWDANTLDFTALDVETEKISDDELTGRLDDYLAANAGAGMSAVLREVTGNKDRLATLLHESSRYVNKGSDNRHKWHLNDHLPENALLTLGDAEGTELEWR